MTANVLELYLMQALDLLNNKTTVNVTQWGGEDFGAFGLSEMEICSGEDLAKLIRIMSSCRSTRRTAMNDTSSRSHCMASICLTRIIEHPELGR